MDCGQKAMLLGLLLLCVAFVAVFIIAGCQRGRCNGTNLNNSPFKELWEFDDQ